MNRLTAIVVSIVAITGAVTFVLLHHAEKSINFEVDSVGQVGPSGMDLSLLACNQSPVPIILEGVEVDLGGSSENYGSLTVQEKLIPPASEEQLQGRLDFVDFNAMKNVIDWTLHNQTSADFNATVLVKAKVLGIIPYSYEENYGVKEFSTFLLGNENKACKTQNGANDIRQQLALVQARMSSASFLYSDNAGVGNETNYAEPNVVP